MLGKSERRKLAQIQAASRRNERAAREAQRRWDAYVRRQSAGIMARELADEYDGAGE